MLCMECGRPGNGVVTSRKGGQWVSIVVEGSRPTPVLRPAVDAAR